MKNYISLKDIITDNKTEYFVLPRDATRYYALYKSKVYIIYPNFTVSILTIQDYKKMNILYLNKEGMKTMQWLMKQDRPDLFK